MKYVIIATLIIGVIALAILSAVNASDSRHFENVCKAKDGIPIITTIAKACLKKESTITL